MNTYSTHLTRCPNCHTAFRVTEAHLSRANGTVRCGECMHIFNARSHFLTSNRAPSSQPQAPEAPSPSSPEQNRNAQPNADTSHQPSNTPPPTHTSTEEPASDESWAINMLREMGEEVDELESEQRQRLKRAHAIMSHSGPAKHSKQPQAPLAHMSFEELHDLDPDFDHQIKVKPKKHTLWYLLAVIIGLLGLSAQYIFTHLDTLSTQERYRRLLAPMCELTGCRLPTFSDITKIKTTDSAFRPDERRAGYFLMDTVIVNRAAFPQPFPMLKITFKTRDNRLVSELLFKPKDYLRKEVSNHLMPSKKPVHMSSTVTTIFTIIIYVHQ